LIDISFLKKKLAKKIKTLNFTTKESKKIEIFEEMSKGLRCLKWKNKFTFFLIQVMKNKKVKNQPLTVKRSI